MAEVKLGKMAQERAASDAVKKFGERMVHDHSRMNTELREIASRQQIALSDRLDPKHQRLVEQLSKLKGAAFDRA